jgi:hypothetical protein
MKKIKTFIAAVCVIACSIYYSASFAQAPQKFSYQTVVRNASQGLVQNQTCGIKISIRSGSAAGTVVYSETHTKTSNVNGLVTLEIGAGTVVSGTMAGILWENNTYYVQTQIDPTGGTNYTISGSNQLLSVPYALNAANGNWNKNGNDIFNSNSGNIGIGTSAPGAKLEVNGTFNVQPVANQKFYIPGWSGPGATYVAGVFESTNIPLLNPQLRFLSDIGTNNYFMDIGMDDDFDFVVEHNDIPYFTVSNNGTVKVGYNAVNSGSVVPLFVSGNADITGSLDRVYFNASAPNLIGIQTTSSGDIQVEAGGYYWANGGGFVATSDRRVKNVIGITDSKKDLSDITKIEITDYKPIDILAGGSGIQKKVIAQQLQSVFPNAVMMNKGIIPNVYEQATNVSVVGSKTTIETKKPHTFQSGDKVKLIIQNQGEKIVCVEVINENKFIVEEAINEKVFVYGKHVDDLLMVDYDALTTLNISATQELAKENNQLKSSLANVQKENEDIKASLQTLMQQMQSLNAKVNALESPITGQIENK